METYSKVVEGCQEPEGFHPEAQGHVLDIGSANVQCNIFCAICHRKKGPGGVVQVMEIVLEAQNITIEENLMDLAHIPSCRSCQVICQKIGYLFFL
jgi:hypothetical protein